MAGKRAGCKRLHIRCVAGLTGFTRPQHLLLPAPTLQGLQQCLAVLHPMAQRFRRLVALTAKGHLAHRIQLPAKTMYLIDKVVRAKALQGPIGVNNSEVINLEQERDLRKKNLYYANLAEKGKIAE